MRKLTACFGFIGSGPFSSFGGISVLDALEEAGLLGGASLIGTIPISSSTTGRGLGEEEGRGDGC